MTSRRTVGRRRPIRSALPICRNPVSAARAPFNFAWQDRASRLLLRWNPFHCIDAPLVQVFGLHVEMARNLCGRMSGPPRKSRVIAPPGNCFRRIRSRFSGHCQGESPVVCQHAFNNQLPKPARNRHASASRYALRPVPRPAGGRCSMVPACANARTAHSGHLSAVQRNSGVTTATSRCGNSAVLLSYRTDLSDRTTTSGRLPCEPLNRRRTSSSGTS